MGEAGDHGLVETYQFGFLADLVTDGFAHAVQTLCQNRHLIAAGYCDAVIQISAFQNPDLGAQRPDIFHCTSDACHDNSGKQEEGEEKFNDQGIIKELVCIHASQEDECLPILKINHFITVPFVELARYMILRIGFHIGELRVVKQNVIAVHLHPDDFLTADPFGQPVRVFFT